MKSRMFCCIALAAALPLDGQGVVFPEEDWLSGSPESQGVDSVLLSNALTSLAAACGSQGTREMMVIRRGHLIWQGDDIDNVHNVWSCTKSFTSTVLGLLIDDGRCTLDTVCTNHLDSLEDHYPEVRLRHFASMTSGYDAPGGAQASDPFEPTAPLFAPGTEFRYWDAAMNQFGYVLTRIAGEPIELLFTRRIADPIGMDSADWHWGDWGTLNEHVVHGGAGNQSKGISISARQMARFGHLFLNRGNWNGQQLISASWTDAATVQQVPDGLPNAPDARGYGYNWWIWPDAPTRIHSASGYNNNHCFVLPDWDMVIVRLGTDGSVDESVWYAFFDQLASAVWVPPPDPVRPAVSIGRLGDMCHVSWGAEAGITYTLQQRDNLFEGAWSDVDGYGDLSGEEGEILGCTVPFEAGRYFRVMAVRP